MPWIESKKSGTKKISALLLIFFLIGANPAQAAVISTGESGQNISISKSRYSKSQLVSVSGKGFDETVGIYLAYCVLPKKGQTPTPCGGGINKNEIGNASYWISSNPPPYGVGLAIAFKAGGRFNEKVSITEKIAGFDCRKITCAITVRSDHLHEGDRTHDIFIPITFAKAKK